MVDSPRFGFSYLEEGETVPSQVVNEMMERVESGAGHFIIEDRDENDPSGLAATAGQAWIVATGGTGDWASHDGDIAYRLNTDWIFIDVQEGFTAYVKDEDVWVGRNSSAWVVLGTDAEAVPSATTAADINAGTEAGEYVTPDALAGSNFGIRIVQIAVSDPAGSAITTGDGKCYFRVPAALNGMNLVSAAASLDTAGTGGGFLCQLRRKRSGSDVDMLSTRISIDSGENDSGDAATPPAINASNDDVATKDRIYIDIDGVPTGAKGLNVELGFQLP